MTQKGAKTKELAEAVWSMAHDTIVMNLRFLEPAMAAIRPVARPGSAVIACDGVSLYYDPTLVLRRYQKDQSSIVRLYLHVLLHFIFHHDLEYEDKLRPEWDLAVDLAVEAVILDLELYHLRTDEDDRQRQKLGLLEKRAGGLSAQKLYRLFRIEEPSDKEKDLLDRLFHRDEHVLWEKPEEQQMMQINWDKISERIKADLKSFSKGKHQTKGLTENLEEATKERVDLGDFLRQFMTSGEEIHVNDEEFDYIYYTYGMDHYGNMPLVEPLEYQEIQKIRDFVIAIDTSASCKGSLVRGFLRKAWAILRTEDSFFRETNIHIIQCDNAVQTDTVIRKEEDLETFLKEGKLTGFGATDFRPVFEYVDRLCSEKELTNLKGLLYFTDGYGIYPERMPEYQTAFLFLKDDAAAPTPPPWAIRILLEEEQVEE